MARKLNDVIAAMPQVRRKRIDVRAMELVTLMAPRLAAQKTQEELAAGGDRAPGARPVRKRARLSRIMRRY